MLAWTVISIVTILGGKMELVLNKLTLPLLFVGLLDRVESVAHYGLT